MTLAILAEKAQKFARSSAYRHGDRTSFSVRLHDTIMLIGSCSASSYLDKLGLTSVPSRVMVVCPGNGGLVTECYRRGAEHVLALEPRPRFQQALRRVMELQAEAWRLEGVQNCTFQFLPTWPLPGRETGFQDFDLIIWSEGVEEVTSPQSVMRGLADCMNPGGKLLIEISHGQNGWVEKINSWRPSGQAVKAMAEALFGGGWANTQGGRTSTTRIYSFVLPGKKAEPKAAAKPKVEKPKKTPAPTPIVIVDDGPPAEAAKEETPVELKAPEGSSNTLDDTKPVEVADKHAAKEPEAPKSKPSRKKAPKKKTSKKKKSTKKKSSDSGPSTSDSE